MNIDAKERTNQYDGTVFVLVFQDSTPLCPHCGQKMVKVSGRWENAMCPCWWNGMNDGVYYSQVVVADSPEAEFEYRTDRSDQAAKAKADREDELMKARLAYAAGDAEMRFSVIHRLRNLHGKRAKKKRNRVRAVITNGASFDEALKHH